MGVSIRIVLLFAMIAAFALEPVCAEDLSDLDAEVEDLTSESDAGSARAKLMRERAQQERQSAAQARRVGEKAKAEAQSRKARASDEIRDAEKEIRNLRAEQTEMQKQVKANENLRSETDHKIADLRSQNRRLEKDLERLADQLETSKREFEKGKLKAKSEDEQLHRSRADFNVRKARLELQIVELNKQSQGQKQRTAAVEGEIRSHRRGLQQLEENVQLAEGEVEQSDSRLRDAKDRLQRLRERNRGRHEELEKRQLASLESQKAMAAREAHVSLDLARQREISAKNTPESGPLPMVQLVPGKPRTCQIFERPDSHSKILGSTIMNSTKADVLRASSGHKKWVQLRLKNNRTGYLSRACF